MIPVILVIIVVLAGLEQIYETFVLGQRKEKGKLKGERWTIFGMGAIHILTFFATLIEYFTIRKTLNVNISFIGLSMYILGVIGRYWSIYTLGRFWSVQIEIRANHKLITNGPYNFMRHPAYFSLFFKVLSIPLILNSYYTFYAVLLTYCPLVFIRLYYEEVEMFKKFRKSYVKLRRERWALFPIPKGGLTAALGKNIRFFRKIFTRW
jgi:isoprenylcysteine carboxyl methyltransferase (ICMT) family protein YpbQ